MKPKYMLKDFQLNDLCCDLDRSGKERQKPQNVTKQKHLIYCTLLLFSLVQCWYFRYSFLLWSVVSLCVYVCSNICCTSKFTNVVESIALHIPFAFLWNLEEAINNSFVRLACFTVSVVCKIKNPVYSKFECELNNSKWLDFISISIVSLKNLG